MTQISYEGVFTILNKKLNMKKVFSKWVSLLFSVEQKQLRVDHSKSCLSLFTHKCLCMDESMTMVETWMHHFAPSVKSAIIWVAHGWRMPPKAFKNAAKRSHMKKKKIIFHQDNAPCHNFIKTMTKFNELGFNSLPVTRIRQI